MQASDTFSTLAVFSCAMEINRECHYSEYTFVLHVARCRMYGIGSKQWRDRAKPLDRVVLQCGFSMRYGLFRPQ